MSFLRIRSPYHEPRDVPLGPSVGRRTMSRLGIRGGGPYVVVYGAMAVGESSKTIEARTKREYNARRDAEAKAAATHDYYLRNKATIMEKQRERRRLVKP